MRAKLHPVAIDGERIGWTFYCPACKRGHIYYTAGGVVWEFNGNTERPTFKPSLLLFTPAWTDTETGEKHPRETVCHLHLTDGKIAYCGGCPHSMAGQTVDMVDWPETYATPGE